jgi:large subunit ribosomal protein L18
MERRLPTSVSIAAYRFDIRKEQRGVPERKTDALLPLTSYLLLISTMALGNRERQVRRLRRHRRVRKKVTGTAERPRLVVYRSLNNLEGQIVDDTRGVTILGISTLAADLKGAGAELTKTERGRVAGKVLAERAREQGITKVVFDRGGYVYHGRVKAFADGAREGGLEF